MASNHTLHTTQYCRSCSQPISWRLTPARKRIPIDPAPVEDGNIVLDDGVAVALSADALADLATSVESVPRYVSHFATCPEADSWRSKGGAR